MTRKANLLLLSNTLKLIVGCHVNPKSVVFGFRKHCIRSQNCCIGFLKCCILGLHTSQKQPVGSSSRNEGLIFGQCPIITLISLTYTSSYLNLEIITRFFQIC